MLRDIHLTFRDSGELELELNIMANDLIMSM